MAVAATLAMVTAGVRGSLPGQGTAYDGLVDAHRWQRVYAEDFNTPAAAGQFPGSAYARTWTVYPDGWKDTSGLGTYAPSRVLSVKDGMLRFNLHSDGGTPLGAAAVPALPTYGQTYGRYSIRFRADPLPGYGLAWLLWPDSNVWPGEGEIDFPEGALDGTITATAHHADPRGTKDFYATNAPFASWHIATVEWLPGGVSFYLDGHAVGQSSTKVPSSSMHLVLQAGTHGNEPPSAGARGQVYVDWVVMYALNKDSA